jgi:hypothetical protein
MDSLGGVQVKLSKVRLEIVYFLSITNCMNEAMFSFCTEAKTQSSGINP